MKVEEQQLLWFIMRKGLGNGACIDQNDGSLFHFVTVSVRFRSRQWEWGSVTRQKLSQQVNSFRRRYTTSLPHLTAMPFFFLLPNNF